MEMKAKPGEKIKVKKIIFIPSNQMIYICWLTKMSYVKRGC